MITHIQFTPTRDFFSPELRSQYIKGLVYTIKPEDGLLQRQASGWAEQGWIALIDIRPKIVGVGTVRDRKETT